jgi:hypothetical protein
MSEELFTPKQAEQIGAPSRVVAKARASKREVLRIVWDKEDGYPEHAWGYVQWSVRPFKQMDGCDGTIDDSVHLIAYRLCSQLGLDYAALIDEAYAWRDKDDNGDWVRETTEEQWQAIERNTIVPKLSTQSLRRLLNDLTDINNHSLAALLHDTLKAMGYDVDEYWEDEPDAD